MPLTVRVSWSWPSAAAKFTLPNVSAAAAPVTNKARLPKPFLSSSMAVTVGGGGELPWTWRESAAGGMSCT
ncbi:hypothetical protein GCM10010121_073280 [Streptomyces brasiliensis]|uniref:Uncharacterized protein n=1 Tax=Streptomyces brasiliensis TaxID=1954 RepID=A0A917L9H8_9ACTN|nr:hypothetical protein GCM10010121_073280 [Streptomyces brasiliensis]